MSLGKAVANALSFASLAGLARKNAAESDEDKEKDKDKDTEEAKAEDDDAPAAESDDDKEKDDDGKEKGAKGKKAESDDDKEPDGDEGKSAAAGERHRCKAIVAHGVQMAVASGGDLGPVIDACMLAFDTSISAKAAIASMEARSEAARALPGRKSASLDDRMAANQVPVVRPEGKPGADGPAGVAKMILAAAAKARGEA